MDAVREWRGLVGMGKEGVRSIGSAAPLQVHGLDHDQTVKNHLPIFFLILSLHRLVKQDKSFNFICRDE